MRFSDLVVEQPWIKELDINPLLASPDGLLALDARVVLHDADDAPREPAPPRDPPLPHPVRRAPTASPTAPSLVVRPIRPEDEGLLVAFHRALGESSVRQRYLAPLRLDQRTTHERLIRVCFSDYDRDIALVVEHRPADGQAGDRRRRASRPPRAARRRRVRAPRPRRLAAAAASAPSSCGASSTSRAASGSRRVIATMLPDNRRHDRTSPPRWASPSAASRAPRRPPPSSTSAGDGSHHPQSARTRGRGSAVDAPGPYAAALRLRAAFGAGSAAAGACLPHPSAIRESNNVLSETPSAVASCDTRSCSDLGRRKRSCPE